ncbi:deoxycytidylate deaminase [Xanthomonas phage Xoo-sp13]|nr:deoxycytidylate deaminase [Xanthomonas phage Xoo-sp13]
MTKINKLSINDPPHVIFGYTELLDSTQYDVVYDEIQYPYNDTVSVVISIHDRGTPKIYYYNSKNLEKAKEFIDFLNSKVVESATVDWDSRFLRLADGELNSWSKDPSTKVSAVIIRGKYPIATSYNGFPPGIEDTVERLNNRELKYKLVQHAEANAISTCAKLGISTEGTTMAVTHFPCSTCAGLMISAGIKKVIVKKPTPDFLSRWKESIDLSKEMFKEAEVELVVIDLDGEK